MADTKLALILALGCCTPNIHLGFDHNNGEYFLYDDSGKDNNAEVSNKLPALFHRGGKCGNAFNVSASGFTFYSNKLSENIQAATIAFWIKLNSAIGRQPILVVSGEDSDLRLEIIGGHVQWFYSEHNQSLPKFNITTNKVINERDWTHVVAQYDSSIGNARLYLDGIKIAEGHSERGLRVQWSWKVVIGRHTVSGEELAINGAIDEFYIFYCALPPLGIRRLHEKCKLEGTCAAPKGKGNAYKNIPLSPKSCR